MSKLILVRGWQGSGKSTFAAYLKHKLGLQTSVILEADMYHTKNGVYDYKPEKVSEGHDWCYQTARVFLDNDYTVIVSNTFTKLKEMKRYIEYAQSNGHEVYVYRCSGNYQNVHNVPEDVVMRFKNRMEDCAGEEYV